MAVSSITAIPADAQPRQILYCAECGLPHCRAMSNAEAAERIITAYPDLSNRHLGRLAGVGHEIIRRVRKRMSAT